MMIQDLRRNVFNVSESADIDRVLTTRYGSGVNSFWLSDGTNLYPLMALMVTRELAYLWYTPSEDHPGFVPVGTAQGLQTGGTTTFFMDNEDVEEMIPNDQIVPFSVALVAAKEFSASMRLPQCMKWFELGKGHAAASRRC